jgi:hypothetical protein
MRLSVSLPAAALLVLAAYGCSGSDGATTAAPTAGARSGAPSGPPPTGSDATSTPAPGSAAPVATPTPAGTAAVRTVRADQTHVFLSPSGNIVCSLAEDSAVCEIADRTFAPPPKPADCELDHGSMVALRGEASAEFLCYGDTGFGADVPALPYGASVTNGVVTCTSAESGVACTSASGAHGFALSRASYRVY